ncbi:glycosyltransferase family A protein [Kribbella sp. NPDC051770]|uniref:glycosyltransferase family 2 protein n=1 Tax=Kribbella sp. NPDC051770 TaxID=3155413 RepID=UPI003444F813
MRICVLTVNHATTPYAELLLASLQHHHDRDDLDVVVLDNSSTDLDRLDRFPTVQVVQTGYTTTRTLTTHGEILRDAVLARPAYDAFLFVDCDVCFVVDGTIDALAAELAADPEAFAVQARWFTHDGGELPASGEDSHPTTYIRESVRRSPDDEWSDPAEYSVEMRLTDRVHPFCALIRNDDAFRRTVEHLGLSPAVVQAERGGKWWDTLGLLTQVMKTHGKHWVLSEQGVIHFGNVSWSSDWAVEKAAARDRLLARYSPEAGLGEAAGQRVGEDEQDQTDE